MKYYHFKEAKSAAESLPNHKNEKTGVYFTSEKLSRGLDMKFALDSLVVCLDIPQIGLDRLKYTQIIQQIGRSSRTRGECIGHVIIDSDEFP